MWEEIYSFGIYSAAIIHPPVESRGLDQQSLRWPLNDPAAFLTSCGSDASDSDVHISVKTVIINPLIAVVIVVPAGNHLK